jgi:hypothetical protein
MMFPWIWIRHAIEGRRPGAAEPRRRGPLKPNSPEMPPWTRDTRFPIGRIKKIMQQDEEVFACVTIQTTTTFSTLHQRNLKNVSIFETQVGKIAKATPVLVSKCLELLIGKCTQSSSNFEDTMYGVRFSITTVNTRLNSDADSFHQYTRNLTEVQRCLFLKIVGKL